MHSRARAYHVKESCLGHQITVRVRDSAIGSLEPTSNSARLARITLACVHALFKPPALPFRQGSPNSVSLAPCDFQESTQDAVHPASLLLRQVQQYLVSKKQVHIIVLHVLPEDRAILASD